LKEGVFLGILEGSDGMIEGVDVGRGQRFRRAGTSKAFSGSGGVPSMGSKEALEI
jgi:hypothetical protein